MKNSSILLLLLLTTLFLPPASALGQGRGAPSLAGSGTETQEEETGSLLDRIRELDGELVTLMETERTVEGEDLLLTRTRISELARQQQENLTALMTLMADETGVAPGIASVEQQGEQLLRRSSRRLRSYIRSFQTALEEEGLRRAEMTPAEIQVFEHRMAEDSHRLDGFYQGLAQLTRQMRDLGLSVEEEEAFLERELTARGENLLRIVELTKTRLDEFRDLLSTAPEDRDLQAQAFASEERYEANKASLLATLHLMKAENFDYGDLEVRTVEATGEITPEVFQIDVAVGLIGRELQRIRAFAGEQGPRLVFRAFLIILIFLAFWVLSGLGRTFSRKILDRTKVANSTLLKQMVVTLTGRLILFLGFMVALSQFGIDMGPILAGLGIAGFVIGFALQDTLANFAAGAMILAYRPFDVGDLVEAAGVTGKVKDMNLTSTRILTIDHQTLIVPNSKIWGDVIRNVTAQPTRRVDMVFGISYQDGIPKAEQVLEEILSAHQKVLKDPEPVVKLHTLNESSVDFVVRPWVRTEDYWDVYWDITREVKIRFDAEGISIPFPQRDVHLYTTGRDASETA